MGRRRRKENARKQSLIFEESPVEIRQYPPSPVVCVDNPVTALPVPVNSDSNISWVSPQFSGINAVYGKRRQARRGHCSTGKKQTGTTFNKENSHVGRSKTRQRSRKRKCLALDFVGDSAKSTKSRKPKLTDNDELTENEGKAEETTALNETISREKSLKNFCGSSGNNRTGTENCCSVETPRRRRSSLRNSANKRHDLSQGQHNLSFCDDKKSSAKSSLPDLPSSLLRKDIPVLPHHVSQPPICSILKDGTGSVSVSSSEAAKHRRSYNSDILLSPPESLAPSQSVGSPTSVLREQKKQLPLMVALFSDSPTDNAIFNNSSRGHSCSGSKIQDDRVKSFFGTPASTDDSKTSIYCEDRNMRSGTRRAKSTRDLQFLSQALTPRRSKRLQEKHRKALKYLCPDKSPNVSGIHTKVLVTDTPENEYHLTIKQRQQLKRK